jgi:hypothetical protein
MDVDADHQISARVRSDGFAIFYQRRQLMQMKARMFIETELHTMTVLHMGPADAA